ncbi:MAG: hypothetical protein M3040_10310, partial [Bacteroidota bacterium]|nr:hypothetical protein [Bacteroidota bacterium]
MSNYNYMAPAFEREKNIKAATYTSILCVLLFIIFFFVKWTLPQIAPPVMEEGIEVNLGNSDQGLGDVAPQIPGKPAAAKEEVYAPPARSNAAPPVAQQENLQGDENETDEAPVVNKDPKPVVRKTIPTPVPVKPKVINRPVANVT